MQFIRIFIIFFSLINSQENLENLINEVLNGSRDDAIVYLPLIEKQYPNNPGAIYLKGLLMTDGLEAKNIFTNLYNNYPTCEYASDAVMKVAEYYYAAGLYQQAAAWLKKMPLYYSRSKHIQRALKLFFNSLIVSGHRDTAIFYSRVFKRQFPNIDIDRELDGLLSKIKEPKKENKKKEENTNIIFSGRNSLNSTQTYSIQAGAFTNLDNAEKQRLDLIKYGFNARSEKLYRKNKILYAIRIGNFSEKSDADEVSERLKSQLDIETIIIMNK